MITLHCCLGCLLYGFWAWWTEHEQEVLFTQPSLSGCKLANATVTCDLSHHIERIHPVEVVVVRSQVVWSTVEHLSPDDGSLVLPPFSFILLSLNVLGDMDHLRIV